MNLTQKISLVSILLGIGLLGSVKVAKSSIDAQIPIVINRLTFGAKPGEIEKIQSLGVEQYIQQQLSPESIPESEELNQQLNALPTLHKTPVEIFKEYSIQASKKNGTASQEDKKAARERMNLPTKEAIQARFLRNLESNRQLQEIMVDFWYNHFNVFSGKGLDVLWVGAYEEQAIRPYALGKFRDLLGATAHHPAMLFYLDNWQNVAPNNKKQPRGGKLQGLNENYARELMELHTLGVDGGYNQSDVIALARILTGWGLRPGQQANDSDGFYFNAKQHDFSDKVFLGKTIKGAGISEGEAALDILARHPATAHHISYQLAQYFVADQPPKSLVDTLTKKFLETDGDIREVLNTLFHSQEFWDTKTYNAKFKTPLQYIISSVRATDLKVNNFRPLYGFLDQLGMPLYGCQTPDGYKNTQDAWLNPDAMTRRSEFCDRISERSDAIMD